jgi:hypothetical protein
MLKAFYQLLGEENKGHRTKCMIVQKKTTDSNNWYNYLGNIKVNSFSSKEKKMITFISVLLFLVDLNNQENIL